MKSSSSQIFFFVLIFLVQLPTPFVLQGVHKKAPV